MYFYPPNCQSYGNYPYMNPYYRYNLQKLNSPSYVITEAIFRLSNRLRELWEQHSVWTRATIASMIFGLPDVNIVTNRLLQNPVDFGNLFSVYYGDNIGLKLSDLITEHLKLAAELVTAAKAGETDAMAEIERRWYANGDEIAVFLSSINPYWSAEEWKMMYRTHLDLVKAESVNLLTKNYEAEPSNYDELQSQALEMADMMYQGIVRQFPDRFR